MKTRRMFLTIILILVQLVSVVSPVYAGPPASTFKFQRYGPGGWCQRAGWNGHQRLDQWSPVCLYLNHDKWWR